VGAEAPDADLPGGLSDQTAQALNSILFSERTMSTGACESQGATRWPQKKAVAAAGPSRQVPFGTEHTKQAIAQQFGVSKNTIDRILRPERIGKTKPVAAISIVSSNCRCGPSATHK
jgi:hypothetical protein